MRRVALVVGINKYPFLPNSRTDLPQNLKTPAGDAEAVAQILESHGDFEVRRLPAFNQAIGYRLTRKL